MPRTICVRSTKQMFTAHLYQREFIQNHGSKTETRNQTWLYRLGIRKVSGCFSQEWKSHPLGFKLKLGGWYDSEGVVVGSLIFERVDKLGWVSFVRWLWQMCRGGVQRCGKIKTGLWGWWLLDQDSIWRHQFCTWIGFLLYVWREGKFQTFEVFFVGHGSV
jgi:hypothetical protein